MFMSDALTIHCLVNGSLEENAYFIYLPQSSEGILIDPGADAEKLDAAIQATGVRPALLLATHGHFDHIGKVHFFQEKYQARFLMHRHDEEMLEALPDTYAMYGLGNTTIPKVDQFLEGGEKIQCGRLELQAIHTPGHSRGGLCFFHEESLNLFSGDTLFRLSVGRSVFPGGSAQALTDSIRKKLFTLPLPTRVYPGHGPATTLGEEKLNNPFLQP
jgi:glyoxylase-like metal-dependent hydrolase (beta-lactamase superfamily II)